MLKKSWNRGFIIDQKDLPSFYLFESICLLWIFLNIYSLFHKKEILSYLIFYTLLQMQKPCETYLQLFFEKEYCLRNFSQSKKTTQEYKNNMIFKKRVFGRFSIKLRRRNIIWNELFNFI